VVIGIVVFAQTFAHLVGYNPEYTDAPMLVTRGKFLFLKPGYSCYNPFLIFLNISRACSHKENMIYPGHENNTGTTGKDSAAFPGTAGKRKSR
jgi:hypothetical protein